MPYVPGMPPFIHVLYVKDDCGWYAQCLEFDIGAQGDSQDEAELAFFRTWHIQIAMDRAHGRKPFESLSGAPQKYWDMWGQAINMHGSRAPDSEEANVPPAYMIAAQVERMRASVPH
jgi:hypothetical protein